jgi:hypothetical protein
MRMKPIHSAHLAQTKHDSQSPNTGPGEGRPWMNEPENTEERVSPLIAVKNEILDVMNTLRQTQEQLQKGQDVSNERIKSLLARGENLTQQISALPGMEQAGKELAEHLTKIGQAILDLKNFDALKKANLVTGVKF